MSLAHTILGLLQQQEMTGYDLKINCFDHCVAHLWPADQAQIYRTLDKLVEKGWLTCTVEIQYDRPNRKLYRITEAGKAEFLLWLQCSHPLPTVRDTLLVQLHFAAQVSDQVLLQLLEQQLSAHLDKLAECQAIAQPAPDDSSATREQMMQRLVVDLVTRREQSYIDGLKAAIEKVQRPQNDPVQHPG
jgi:PadR family transcriptional regulator, regulatory protein AphA